jgi:hypothetical protein
MRRRDFVKAMKMPVVGFLNAVPYAKQVTGFRERRGHPARLTALGRTLHHLTRHRDK